jgi:ParB-like chromosome segregation protein Spo0J
MRTTQTGHIITYHPDPSEDAALEDHPLAALFPLMEEADLEALAEDIREHGLRGPITLYEGKILDGRNRYRACKLAGIAPKTRIFAEGKDALAFSLAANLHRRHLTASQRAIVAAKIAQLPIGGDREEQRANLPSAPSMAEAASKLSVSRRLVVAAKTVIKNRDQTKAVESGKKTVHAAVQDMKAAQAAQAGDNRPLRDTTGYPIPEELAPLWARKPEVEALLRHISEARCAVKAAAQQSDILFAPTNLNGVLADLNNAYTLTQLSVPYAVCATCQGRTWDTCLSCKGRGFLSKHHFDRCVPEELKAIRAKECQ